LIQPFPRAPVFDFEANHSAEIGQNNVLPVQPDAALHQFKRIV